MKHLALTVALLATTTSILGQDFTLDQEIEDNDALTEFSVEKVFAKQDRQLELWSDLQKARVAGDEAVELDVWLDEAQRIRLDAADKGTAKVPNNLIGVHQPVEASFSMNDWDPSGHKLNTASLGQAALRADGSFVWTTSVRSTGASALRLRFTGFDLPQGAALYIYNDDGQAHGPYRDKGPHGSGEFWSHTVFGDTARVQLQVDAKAFVLKFGQRPASFEIAKVSHLGDRFQVPAFLNQNKADCSRNVDCVKNAECYDWDELSLARRAVALLSYEEEDEGGASYGCSGGLLNDKDSSGHTPWLLTANHCISSETEADSVEAFFQYQSNCGSCNGSYVDSVLGSDLWATGSTTDFTLLELSELPSSWALMGWTNATILDNDGELLYRISHPKGSPQSLSTHEVVGQSSGNYIKTKNILGTVEEISSGSPIFRDDQKVVGQVRGTTYTNEDLYDLCDPSTFNLRDGAMSTYWRSVRPYLSSPSNTNKMHVSEITASVLNAGVFKFAIVRVTVVDGRGNGIPRATVRGSFSGDVFGSFAAGTDDQGQATIISFSPFPVSSKLSFTFCVSDVTHTYFNTYDSAANVETCESH